MKMPTTGSLMTPDQVLKAYYLALNSGDLESALALFHDRAVRLDTAVPGRIIEGRAQIEGGLRARIADHIAVEATGYQVQGNTVTCFAKVYTDYARRLGFAPVEEKVEVIIDDGLIRSFAITVTPESLARIAAAQANQ
jgi:hypothetical protein